MKVLIFEFICWQGCFPDLRFVLGVWSGDLRVWVRAQTVRCFQLELLLLSPEPPSDSKAASVERLFSQLCFSLRYRGSLLCWKDSTWGPVQANGQWTTWAKLGGRKRWRSTSLLSRRWTSLVRTLCIGIFFWGYSGDTNNFLKPLKIFLHHYIRQFCVSSLIQFM